jgi:hypothetical protein
MDRFAWLCFFLASVGSFSCGGDVIVVRTNDAAATTDTGSVDSVADSAPDAQTCAQLQAATKATFHTSLAGYNTCAIDSDCTYATSDCLACCDFPIINSAYASTVGAASNVLCDQLAAEGCAVPQCTADCVGIELRCIAGTCQSAELPPDAGTDSPPDTQSCADLQTSARNTLGATMTANQACASDADCVWANVGCFAVGTIPTPSSVAGEAVVESLASQLCAQLATEGCEPVNPGLPSPNLTIYCGNGQCTF